MKFGLPQPEVSGVSEVTATPEGCRGPAQISDEWMWSTEIIDESTAVTTCCMETGVAPAIARRSWRRAKKLK